MNFPFIKNDSKKMAQTKTEYFSNKSPSDDNNNDINNCFFNFDSVTSKRPISMNNCLINTEEEINILKVKCKCMHILYRLMLLVNKQ
jgi:hypothetical protein